MWAPGPQQVLGSCQSRAMKYSSRLIFFGDQPRALVGAGQSSSTCKGWMEGRGGQGAKGRYCRRQQKSSQRPLAGAFSKDIHPLAFSTHCAPKAAGHICIHFLGASETSAGCGPIFPSSQYSCTTRIISHIIFFLNLTLSNGFWEITMLVLLFFQKIH